jgi:hypothetical protein
VLRVLIDHRIIFALLDLVERCRIAALMEHRCALAI